MTYRNKIVAGTENKFLMFFSLKQDQLWRLKIYER